MILKIICCILGAIFQELWLRARFNLGGGLLQSLLQGMNDAKITPPEFFNFLFICLFNQNRDTFFFSLKLYYAYFGLALQFTYTSHSKCWNWWFLSLILPKIKSTVGRGFDDNEWMNKLILKMIWKLKIEKTDMDFCYVCGALSTIDISIFS